MDLDHANIGAPQIVKMTGLSSGTVIYIFVISLEDHLTYSCTVTVTEVASLTS